MRYPAYFISRIRCFSPCVCHPRSADRFICCRTFISFVYGMVYLEKYTASSAQDATPLSSKKQILFALSVSLLNPHAILDTIGVIGTSSLSYTGVDKVVFAGATILVSWIWFFGLAVAGKTVGQIDASGKIMRIINKISAIIIWIVAAYIAFKLFKWRKKNAVHQFAV